MKAILLAILLVLIPSMVSADSVTVDGVTITYNPEEVSETEILDIIEKFGPPPAPPTLNQVAEPHQMHEDDDSGPSIADLDLAVEIADYNASHGWLNAIPC